MNSYTGLLILFSDLTSPKRMACWTKIFLQKVSLHVRGLVLGGQQYSKRDIDSHMLVDAYWGNGRDVPDKPQFMTSTSYCGFWRLLIS